MATTTRTPRATGAPQGRFARGGGATRSQGLRRRRQPAPSGCTKILSAVLPAAAAKQATPTSRKGKAGGLALAAAAAGMAFRNRDKLSRLRHRDADRTGHTGATTNTAAPPSTPAV